MLVKLAMVKGFLLVLIFYGDRRMFFQYLNQAAALSFGFTSSGGRRGPVFFFATGYLSIESQNTPVLSNVHLAINSCDVQAGTAWADSGYIATRPADRGACTVTMTTSCSRPRPSPGGRPRSAVRRCTESMPAAAGSGLQPPRSTAAPSTTACGRPSERRRRWLLSSPGTPIGDARRREASRRASSSCVLWIQSNAR